MSQFAPPPSLEPEQDVEMMCALFGISAESFIAEFNRRQRIKFERAMRLQRYAAKVQGHRRTIRAGSVGGEVTQQIHPTLFHCLRRRFGAEALRDPEFNRDLVKYHPELKVTSKSERLTIIKPEFRTNSAPNKSLSVRGKRGRWAT